MGRLAFSILTMLTWKDIDLTQYGPFVTMSFWDGSFFHYYVPYLNEEPPVEYSYGTIDLNAEHNADVGFDSQASYAQQNDYGFVYDDSKQSNPEETNEEKSTYSNIN
ncbi:hypothetical protein E3N88_42790 [Mikania micrantha]|uniref:Uncharacterized protein n=1 Tax=Mikania micrantha TaxID=192012 RepID=A0A5N6LHM5_9ASTR|nr:hypothetical protein E3N88_42790 [Mikania micrantha]